MTGHASSDCSAAGTVAYQEQGEAVAVGETVTVDGIPAQKLAVTGERDTETGRAAFSENQIVALTADGLRHGGPDDLDAGGMMHFAPEILTRPETQVQHPAPPQSPPPSVAGVLFPAQELEAPPTAS